MAAKNILKSLTFYQVFMPFLNCVILVIILLYFHVLVEIKHKICYIITYLHIFKNNLFEIHKLEIYILQFLNVVKLD